MNEYGLIGNVVNDRILRTGARVTILWLDGLAERAYVSGLNRHRRRVDKWIPLKRVRDVRPAFLPEPLRDRVVMRGNKMEADRWAAGLNPKRLRA